jgi:Recombination enhancement, RecA-dependent nuclease
MSTIEKNYMARVAGLGCIVCLEYHNAPDSPAEIHHITTARGFGGRASNYDIIPLCPIHHRLGNKGEAVHSGVKTWEAKYGTQKELLEKVRSMLGT